MARPPFSRDDLKKRSRNPVDPAFRGSQQGPLDDFNAPSNHRPDNIGQQNQFPGSSTQQPRPQQAWDQDWNQDQKGKNNQDSARAGNQKPDNFEFPELDDGSGEDNEIKKLIITGVVIALVLISISVGLYAYLKYSKQSQEEPTESPSVSPTSSETQKPQPTRSDQLPADTSTHKHIEIDTATQSITDLELALKEYFRIAQQENRIIEVSFYRKGSSQEMSFTDLAKVMELTLPEEVSRIIANNFNFLIVPNQGQNNTAGIALILTSIYADQERTKQIIKNWESNIVFALKNYLLFLNESELRYNPIDAIFNDSSVFEGGRYINLSQDNTVSLNYIIKGDKIIIANNFIAFQKGVDYYDARKNQSL
ncbi:MAG: hypothetical protein GF332_02180 [Candidatus Moranbacteria bacterium]|nr:hypothetical protein [Candidatus Moranbacteria bacterium]